MQKREIDNHTTAIIHQYRTQQVFQSTYSAKALNNKAHSSTIQPAS